MLDAEMRQLIRGDLWPEPAELNATDDVNQRWL